MQEETVPVKATAADAVSGMLNVFVDPAATAKQVVKKGFWLWPVIVLCLVTTFIVFLEVPIRLRVMEMNPPGNVSHEQFEKGLPIARILSYIGVGVTPVILIGILLLIAWLINVAGSILGVRAKFEHLFSLVSVCSLITLLQLIAGYIVIRMKGQDIQSVQELQPPFGLDIFFSDISRPLLAVFNFFSIFEIWYIIMLGFGLAFLAKCPKGKAFLAITPAWLVPLIFAVGASSLVPK